MKCVCVRACLQSFKAILRINGTEIDLLSVKASNPSANDSKKTDHGPVTSEQVQPDFVSELLPTSDSNIVWDYSYRILVGGLVLGLHTGHACIGLTHTCCVSLAYKLHACCVMHARK